MITLSKDIQISPRVLNRHMSVSGATGTGKTYTLQKLVEQLEYSDIRYAITDIKGDVVQRYTGDVAQRIGLPTQQLCRLQPEVIGKLLGLNEIQMAALMIVFKAEPEIYTWSELRYILEYVFHDPKVIRKHGIVAKTTIGVILRQMVFVDETLVEDLFVEEGNFDAINLLQNSSIIDCTRLVESPNVYAAIMIGMIDRLYMNLPEVGDLNKPRLVIIIDEAHMLFADTPKVLLAKIEQRVRLIRSKGVSIVFASQSATDVPELINTQIATRIQHGVRVYTHKENNKAIATAKGYSLNFKEILEDIKGLGTGEVLFQTLDGETGAPTEPIIGKIDVLNEDGTRREN